MLSPRLPKSVKLDTLPDDLKKLADKLISDKFGLEKEEQEPEVVSKKDTFIDGTPQFTRYRLVPIRRSTEYPLKMSSKPWDVGYRKTPDYYENPRIFEKDFPMFEDPLYVADKIRRLMDDLEAKTGYEYQVERQTHLQ